MMTASDIRRRWLTGLVVGLAFGVGTLVGGTVIGALGIVSVALLAAGPPRAAIGLALTWAAWWAR